MTARLADRTPARQLTLAAGVALVLVAGVFAAGCGGGSTTNITVVSPNAITSTPTIGTYRVPSGSMEPTFAIGQRVTVAPLGSTPQVGGVVVFHPPGNAEQEVCGAPREAGAACSQAEPNESSVMFIKRIVGGPGDTISIINGHVIRNGKPVPESYIRPCVGAAECNFPTPIKGPAGQWFVLGDNRGESDDSRFWGPVPTAWIVGAVK
jgi:signal peptidase I